MLQQIHLHLISAYQRILENCYRIIRKIHQQAPIVDSKGSLQTITSIHQELGENTRRSLAHLSYLVDISIEEI